MSVVILWYLELPLLEKYFMLLNVKVRGRTHSSLCLQLTPPCTLLTRPVSLTVFRIFYSCCGCSSAAGSAADGWTWSASGCFPWSRRPGWPASTSVRASWRRSCRWPWRRTWGEIWWRRAVGACRWGGPACKTRWLCSRGPAGWTLQTGGQLLVTPHITEYTPALLDYFLVLLLFLILLLCFALLIFSFKLLSRAKLL